MDVFELVVFIKLKICQKLFVEYLNRFDQVFAVVQIHNFVISSLHK